MLIHPDAYIDPDAQLGHDVTVGPGAVIESEVIVGDGCCIAPNAVIRSGTTLGSRCRVFPGAVIGDEPQDLAYGGAPSRVEIGAETVLREGVTVHRGTQPETVTRIGDRCYLMANSHVGHNSVLGIEVVLANNVLLGGYVTVGDRAFLSGNCVVHQFCTIGRLALMSGLSGLSKDLPPFCILQNLASNQVAALNTVGLRRAGFSPDERRDLKRAFRMLYLERLNVKQAIVAMQEAFPSGVAAELWQFAAASKRGICDAKPTVRDE